MKTLWAGGAGHDRVQERAMAQSAGSTSRPEPAVGFTSIESFARMPSRHNRELPALIARQRPD